MQTEETISNLEKPCDVCGIPTTEWDLSGAYCSDKCWLEANH